MGKFWDRFRGSLPTNSIVMEPVEIAPVPEVVTLVEAELVAEVPSTDSKLKANCQVTNNYKLSEKFTEVYNLEYDKLIAAKQQSAVSADFKKQRVYVFNLSDQEFQVTRTGMFRELIIPARGVEQEYSLAFSIPTPYPMQRSNVDAGEIDIIWEDGRRVVTDIINPNDLGIDPHNPKTGPFPTSTGTDLSVRGVFWSLREKPLRSEINLARKRMEKYYRDLIAQLWLIVTTGRWNNVHDSLSDDHKAAARYFAAELPWYPNRPETGAIEKNQTQGA